MMIMGDQDRLELFILAVVHNLNRPKRRNSIKNWLFRVILSNSHRHAPPPQTLRSHVLLLFILFSSRFALFFFLCFFFSNLMYDVMYDE